MKYPAYKRVYSGHRWPYYARGAGKIAVFIAVFKFIESVLFFPSVGDNSRWLVAAALSSTYLLAGAALNVLALLGWVSQHLFGWPAPEPPSPIQHTRQTVQTPEMRAQMLGFNVVASWVVLGVLLLIMMADTRSGPLARIASELFGSSALTGLAIFVLGLPVIAAPLVLLAWLPWQTRLPLLAGLQAAVKSPVTARVHRQKRP